MGENPCYLFIWQELVSRLYKDSKNYPPQLQINKSMKGQMNSFQKKKL